MFNILIEFNQFQKYFLFRCIFININPETAERHSQFQPLKQLKEYRSIVPNDSPVMGIHIGLRKNGKFKIGEPIYIAEVV